MAVDWFLEGIIFQIPVSSCCLPSVKEDQRKAANIHNQHFLSLLSFIHVLLIIKSINHCCSTEIISAVYLSALSCPQSTSSVSAYQPPRPVLQMEKSLITQQCQILTVQH